MEDAGSRGSKRSLPRVILSEAQRSRRTPWNVERFASEVTGNAAGSFDSVPLRSTPLRMTLLRCFAHTTLVASISEFDVRISRAHSAGFGLRSFARYVVRG